MSKEQPPLRISQLDAGELDGDLQQILRERFRNCFKFLKWNWLISYDPELQATLKLVLWKFTIFDKSASVGQQLLDLEYRAAAVRTGSSSQNISLSRTHKILFAVLSIVGPWLTQRAHTLSKYTAHYSYSTQVLAFVNQLETFWKVASLLNFLVFLRQGKFQYLMERVLGIRSMFPKPQGVRQVGFEYMDRELLWHGFAEFLFFILPLINFRKIKNMVMRSLLSRSTMQLAKERVPADYQECAVCGEWPYTPHHIGCKHVFCYYCLQANFDADPGFSCPVCGLKIADQSSIQPVKMEASTVIDAT